MPLASHDKFAAPFRHRDKNDCCLLSKAVPRCTSKHRAGAILRNIILRSTSQSMDQVRTDTNVSFSRRDDTRSAPGAKAAMSSRRRSMLPRALDTAHSQRAGSEHIRTVPMTQSSGDTGCYSLQCNGGKHSCHTARRDRDIDQVDWDPARRVRRRLYVHAPYEPWTHWIHSQCKMFAWSSHDKRVRLCCLRGYLSSCAPHAYSSADYSIRTGGIASELVMSRYSRGMRM